MSKAYVGTIKLVDGKEEQRSGTLEEMSEWVDGARANDNFKEAHVMLKEEAE